MQSVLTKDPTSDEESAPHTELNYLADHDRHIFHKTLHFRVTSLEILEHVGTFQSRENRVGDSSDQKHAACGNVLGREVGNRFRVDLDEEFDN